MPRQSMSRWLLRPEQWSPLLELVDERPVLTPVVCVFDTRFTRDRAHRYARHARHHNENAATSVAPDAAA